MELVYVKKHRRDDGGFDIEPAVYGGIDLSVGGNTYPVKREGTRSIVNVPDTEAHHLHSDGHGHSFMAVPAMHDAIVNSAAQKAMADRAAELVAASDRAAESRAQQAKDATDRQAEVDAKERQAEVDQAASDKADKKADKDASKK